jgi:hypothetical protein
MPADRLSLGDPDGYGRYGVLEEQPGGLVCHECGRASHTRTAPRVDALLMARDDIELIRLHDLYCTEVEFYPSCARSATRTTRCCWS